MHTLDGEGGVVVVLDFGGDREGGCFSAWENNRVARNGQLRDVAPVRYRWFVSTDIPEPHGPEKHYHEPPNANTRVPSCIDVEPVDIVTRAVLKCWRTALERDDPTLVNMQSNPP